MKVKDEVKRNEKIENISLFVGIISIVIFVIKINSALYNTIFGILAFFGISMKVMIHNAKVQKLAKKAIEIDPEITQEEFEKKYSSEISLIQLEEKENQQRMHESRERMKQQDIIHKTEMKELEDRLEKEKNFEIAKSKYGQYSQQLANARKYGNDEGNLERLKAEAEADMHKYSN